MSDSPTELMLLMLYDGAIRYPAPGFPAHFATARRDVSRERIRQAQACIDELNRTLDMRHGELPLRLRSIYSFSTRHLIDSTAAGDPDGFDRVASLLAELRESWATIAEREQIVAQSA